MPTVARKLHGLDDAELIAFSEFGRPTFVTETRVSFRGRDIRVPTYVNEFWTPRQRAASSLHEISYRACFKPQLPRFFIDRLTRPGERVHDPFMGRGTTLLEAALAGRRPSGSDINPLATMLVAPRLAPPDLPAIQERLETIDVARAAEVPEDLLVFYHPATLAELCALRAYLLARAAAGELDAVDAWIRMVAVNRLTGHSPGFFSVYTLPPNQAVSIAAQRKINRDRAQVPPRRDVRLLIVKKSRQLLSRCSAATRRTLAAAAKDTQLLTGPAAATPQIADASVHLVVTSPPFLDVVDYQTDNWLRSWFCGVDPSAVGLTMSRRLDEWQEAMTQVFRELGRMLVPGGHVAFEVGEVRRGKIRLEENALSAGLEAGLVPQLVLINDQKFTKTAQCWGVENGAKGTNTNRIVIFRRIISRSTP